MDPIYPGARTRYVNKPAEETLMRANRIGTRVPIRILFEHLEAGDPLEVFQEDFPSVSREFGDPTAGR